MRTFSPTIFPSFNYVPGMHKNLDGNISILPHNFQNTGFILRGLIFNIHKKKYIFKNRIALLASIGKLSKVKKKDN